MSAASRAWLYLDAARSMRPGQLAGRLRRLLPPAAIAPAASGPPRWEPVGDDIRPTAAPQSGPTPSPGETRAFEAVGARREFPSAGFWSDRADGLLFLFHLHGFAPLTDYVAGPRHPSGDRFWTTLLRSWLDASGEPGLPGWHPYPTSERILSWSAALSAGGWPPPLHDAMVASLWRQARYLRRCVEHDIGGNHVLKNALALMAAGASFPDSRLLPAGTRLLEREAYRQFLPDGGHEERSTSYHREVTEGLGCAERLIARAGRPANAWLEVTSSRAATWQEALAGPDGRLPLLNDAWEGPALGCSATDGLTVLADSGYAVVRAGGDALVFDAGPICPPHLPPHAHADVLSFVLWADGRPLVVDPGAYAYTGPWRDVFRSTGSHNTVEVDGVAQCRFWGDFRAGYHPRVVLEPARRQGPVVVLGGWHDGYRRLADPVDHHRRVVWWPGRGVVVADLLRGRGRHRVRSPLHLHPDVGLSSETGGKVGPMSIRPLGGPGKAVVRPGQYGSFLGTMRPCSVLEDQREIGPEEVFGWSLLRQGGSVVDVTRERVRMAVDGDEPIDVPLKWE